MINKYIILHGLIRIILKMKNDGISLNNMRAGTINYESTLYFLTVFTDNVIFSIFTSTIFPLNVYC